jgi:Transposase
MHPTSQQSTRPLPSRCNQDATLYVSLELSHSTWLLTSLSPGSERMSKHSSPAGDGTALLGLLARLRAKAADVTGRSVRIAVIQEAGLDGFWVHRLLEANGIESHVVDPASIAVPRRRRRAKTDAIDGETLLRTLLAWKRGEPRVCSMVVAPSPEQEDCRRICRERAVLLQERVRHVNRIKGLLSGQGIIDYGPLHRDRREQLDELRTRAIVNPAVRGVLFGRRLPLQGGPFSTPNHKSISTKEESRLMPDGQMRPAERPPILWIALGRQRVGKTVLLNTAVQYFRGLGNPLRVWNADQQNRSHTLSLFFPDAEEVTGSGIEDGMAWTEARIEHQIAHGYDAVLDVGGGATGFAKLVQEVPLLDALDSSSLLVVGLFCTGPERADLDYLKQFTHADMFMPPASVVVFNSGLVLSGRSAAGAFAPIMEASAVKLAILSSLITSPVIKSPVFAKPSKRAMPVSGSCQPTPPISIRLRRASPKSRRAYARPNLAAARHCGTKQAASFKTLPQTNAPTS